MTLRLFLAARFSTVLFASALPSPLLSLNPEYAMLSSHSMNRAAAKFLHADNHSMQAERTGDPVFT
jgi:hypothetical protein